MPQHSFAASAERDADGHLPPSADRAGEQEAGQVRARDQQHAHGRAEQRDEQRTALGRHAVAQADHADAGLFVLFRILLLQPAGQQGHLGPRRVDGDITSQPCNSLQIVVVAIDEVGGNEAHRRPELGATAGEVEVARHDANDGVDLPVEAHGAPHDRRITTELLLPERIAHKCRRWRAIDVVRRRERPAHHRAHGKRGENIGGHGRPLQTERLPRADQIHREPAIGAERFERGRHLFQVAVVGRRELHARKARTLFREPHQTIGLRKRQRSNQHEIGERERCGRRADAKRDDGDRGQGKRRRAAQRPQRVAQVLPEDVPVDAGGSDAGISDHAQPQRGHAERGSRVSPFARKNGRHLAAVLVAE